MITNHNNYYNSNYNKIILKNGKLRGYNDYLRIAWTRTGAVVHAEHSHTNLALKLNLMTFLTLLTQQT